MVTVANNVNNYNQIFLQLYLPDLSLVNLHYNHELILCSFVQDIFFTNC